jgi:hypothetical protein
MDQSKTRLKLLLKQSLHMLGGVADKSDRDADADEKKKQQHASVCRQGTRARELHLAST